MRLIDADELMQEIESISVTVGGINVLPSTAKRSVMDIINYAPTVDPLRHGEWINVADRLPKDGKRVLVVISAAKHKSIYMDIDTDRRVNGKWVRWDRCITHWMPLPELPMDGGEHDGQ